jgi:hypothetical protein
MALLHRAYQLGFQHDPPLAGRVPHFPKLPEGEPRKGFFLKSEPYRNLLQELPEELRLLFVIAYHVGLRRALFSESSGLGSISMRRASGWREGGQNRKPEPVAGPTTETWRNFWESSRDGRTSYLPADRGRLRTFATAGRRPVSAPEFRTCSFTICEGPPCGISVGRRR